MKKSYLILLGFLWMNMSCQLFPTVDEKKDPLPTDSEPTVSINQIPQALADSLIVNEDFPLTVSNLLENDTDPDQDPLSIESFTQPQNGSLAKNESGELIYVPTLNFHGSDLFSYTITDGRGGTASAEVKIEVQSQNDAPVAMVDVASTLQGSAVRIPVLLNDTDIDGDVLKLVLPSNTSEKGASLEIQNNEVIYTPQARHFGTDTFSYIAEDPSQVTSKATVTVSTEHVNTSPIAVNDTASTLQGQSIEIDVLANDSDADQEVLQVQSVSHGRLGLAVLLPNGRIRYTPGYYSRGADEIQYTVVDPVGATARASININITPLNHAPIVASDEVVTGIGRSITIPVLNNDSDPDGDNLSVLSLNLLNVHGQVTISSDHRFVIYTPAAGFNGTDEFFYIASDPNYMTSTGKVTVKVSTDADWDNQYAMPGVQGFDPHVKALAVQGDEIYIGGSFTSVGGVGPIDRIVVWNARTRLWSKLGTGVSGSNGIPSVHSIAVVGDDVFVGGNFTTASGVAALGIAKWNHLTKAWTSLGTGLSGGAYSVIYSMVVHGTDLYVGGTFTQAGGVSVNGIAKWSLREQTWSAVSVPIGAPIAPIRALCFDRRGMLYAAGNVGVLRWDGNRWSQFGGGILARSSSLNSNQFVTGSAYVLAVHENKLFIGGSIDKVGNATRYIETSGVVQWDTENEVWSSFGTGLKFGGFPNVLSLAVTGTDLYVGGNFDKANEISVNSIARWNFQNQAWYPLGNGATDGFGTVLAIVRSSHGIFAGGNFLKAGDLVVNSLARWGGSQWNTIGKGTNKAIDVMVSRGNEIFIGGDFTEIEGIPVNRIARWDGMRWSSLGTGLNGRVYAIAFASNGDVYAGGSFTQAGGLASPSIARWDGTNWHAVGVGLGGTTNPTVYALAVDGNKLYIGGSFQVPGVANNYNIVAYDVATQQFSPLADGFGSSGWNRVRAICVHSSKVKTKISN